MKEISEVVPRLDLQWQVGDGRSRIDLHRLKELSDSISVDDPRDRSNQEDLAGLREGRRACGKNHLVRQGSSTQTPYLARQLSTEYRR